MQKKLFQFFLSRQTGAFGTNIKKKPQKPRQKIEKICILYIYREYLLSLQSNVSGSFLQRCINFVEQQLKLSHFEGNIIP